MMVYKQEVTGCHRDLFFLFALVKCLSKSQLFFIVTGHALKESAVPLGLIVGFGGKSPIHLYRQELLREPTVRMDIPRELFHDNEDLDASSLRVHGPVTNFVNQS